VSTRKRIDALTTLDAVQAYMDDAAMFPEHFKPGTVRGHQRDYAALKDAIEELIIASKAFQSNMSGGNQARWNRAVEAFV
jgi:hypothetical protein